MSFSSVLVEWIGANVVILPVLQKIFIFKITMPLKQQFFEIDSQKFESAFVIHWKTNVQVSYMVSILLFLNLLIDELAKGEV